MAQLKFIVVLGGRWGETKQLLLFVYATQQHMSAGPSMARGGLGSAWSLKVAAVWTNLPVSHVTPSVSPGMWEEAAHPRSCHTVSALPFFFNSPSLPPPFPPPSLAMGFCVVAACKRLTSYLEHPERMAALLLLLLLFFPPKFKVQMVQKAQLPLVISLWRS